MNNAITWFEIPSTRLDQAQAFYEAVLGCTMRREPMGPSEGAVFPYAGEGVGGAIMAGPSAPAPAAGGTLVYLDASPSLDAALARVVAAGGRDVTYMSAQEAPILPLLDQFEFVEDRQRWGYKFRFGLFKVVDADMRLIAQAMQADLTALSFQ